MDQNEPNENVQDEPKIDECEPTNVTVSDNENCTPFSESWIKRHHEAIMAWSAIGGFITTIMLALFAGMSLEKVKEYNKLAFKQFVVSNMPTIIIYPKQNFISKDGITWMYWVAENRGGYVVNPQFKSLIFDGKIKDKQIAEIGKVIVGNVIKQKLDRNQVLRLGITFEGKEQTDWIEGLLKDNESDLFLLLQVNYTIPAELSLTGKPSKDLAYSLFTWHRRRKAFDDVQGEDSLRILTSLKAMGYF